LETRAGTGGKGGEAPGMTCCTHVQEIRR
jgi:hypothetical protein